AAEPARGSESESRLDEDPAGRPSSQGGRSGRGEAADRHSSRVRLHRTLLVRRGPAEEAADRRGSEGLPWARPRPERGLPSLLSRLSAELERGLRRQGVSALAGEPEAGS